MSSRGTIITVRLLGVVAQLAVIKCYSALATTDEIGLFYYYSTLSYIANAALLVPLEFLLQPIMMTRSKTSGLNGFCASLMPLVLPMFACAIIIDALLYVGGVNSISVVMLCGFSITQFMLLFYRRYLNNFDHGFASATLSLLEPAARVVLFLCYISIAGASGLGMVGTTFLAQIIIVFLLHVWIRKSDLYGIEEQRIDILRLLRRVWPLSLSGILNLIQLQGYRLILVPLGYTEEVGIFALVSQIGGTASAACGTVFNQLEQPKIYKDLRANFRKYMVNLLALSGVLLVGALVVSSTFLPILTGQKYAVFWPLVLVGVFNEICNLFIGGWSVKATMQNGIQLIGRASLLGGGVFLVCLGALVWNAELTPWLIALPLVLSQLAVVMALFISYGENR